MIAVAADAQGRNERGQPLDEFQGGDAHLRAASGPRLGQTIELVVTALLEALQGEAWSRLIAQHHTQLAT